MVDKKYFAAAAIAIAALLWAALAWLGGPLNRVDHAAIDTLSNKRAAHPFLTQAGIWISLAGSAPATLGLSLVGGAFLIWRGQLRHAAALIAIVLAGRLMVEFPKLAIGRPRPDLDLHAVTIHSLSFPSGHATNSMTALVAVALFCAPERRRGAALAFAIAASLIIGASRPLLGVHWPSDVLAGWIFGLAWAVGWWWVLTASSLRLGTVGAATPLLGARRQKMTAIPRDPAEQALIEDAENEPTPSQSGGSGGDIARDVGSRDELVRGTGKDAGVTRVHKSDKPNDGDEPNLPNRS